MCLKELVPTRHQRANTDDAGNRGLVPGASAMVSTLAVTGNGVDDGVNIGDGVDVGDGVGATVSASARRRCRRRRDGVGVGTK